TINSLLALFASLLAGLAPAFTLSPWSDLLDAPPPQPQVIVCEAPVTNGAAPPSIHARAWAVYDPASRSFLAGHNEHLHARPASLTKIVTALVALESGDFGRRVVVDIDSRQHTRSSDVGIIPGQTTTLEDLFVGMLTVSGNDAAREIALEVSGDEAVFAAEMNEMVRSLGLHDTHLVNSHGRDADLHYSTAHDMAILAAAALSHDRFRQVVGAPATTIEIDGAPMNLSTTNRFLRQYPGATGVKTGFTSGAGPSLAASAVNDGRELVVVILNDSGRFEDAGRLLDWAFASHTWNC
ncbi:MAG: hypothetical protein GEU28_06145, partial [Dehalococcoidia bacterium]|nr:hypothetical protein [Dehalococcoidia bacterium]